MITTTAILSGNQQNLDNCVFPAGKIEQRTEPN